LLFSPSNVRTIASLVTRDIVYALRDKNTRVRSNILIIQIKTTLQCSPDFFC
jgi:hypothetical protein